MEPLKEMFNAIYFKKLATNLSDVYPILDKKKFLNDLLEELASKSLNERMRHTSQVLRKHLPDHYKIAVKILDQLIPKMDKGYTALVFPDFVGKYGLEYPALSLRALKNYTSFGSSEFAIREFLRNDFEQTIHTMYAWAKDANHHVRRLASEGSRPRLPWSFKLDAVIEHPKWTEPILGVLKTDPELYVRKSVANHLNDISKENPDYMLQLIQSWGQGHPHTDWIIKHASRTLIKKGNTKALSLFNIQSNPKVKVENFNIIPRQLKLGESLEFSCTITSISKVTQKILIDYIIHYVKQSGNTSPKIFKLKTFELLSGATIKIFKKQKFVDFSTRIHYAGEHKIELQVNGKVMSGGNFRLV